MNEEKKQLETYIKLLPQIEDILDLQVPGTFILVKPYNIDSEVKTASGIILTTTEDIKLRTLSKGVVVTAGKACQEITPGMEVYFYKPSAKGAFTYDGDIYQLYQEYDIHAYLPVKKSVEKKK